MTTDKARELLERAYQYIPMSSVTSQEIRAYLAEPEFKSDPDSIDLQSRCRGDKL